MPRLFQITEDDLATLERDLPNIADPLNMRHYDNAMRARIRRVQKILSDIRFKYQPYGGIEYLPADPPQSDGGCATGD